MGNKIFNGTFASLIDIGRKRLTNDDQAISMISQRGKHVLLLVCDGMGGQNKGNYASYAAIEFIKEKFEAKRFFVNAYLTKKWIRNAINGANKIVYSKSVTNESYRGCGTTLSLAFITKKRLITAQMGDSRVYSLNNRGKFTQLTEDETVAMHEYRIGNINKTQLATHPKRHILTNALGVHKVASFEMKEFPYNQETILVCSDGLYNNATEQEILSIIRGADSTQEKVTELISQANANGGSDNIAVSLWEAAK